MILREFKELPKPKQDEFVAKLMHAVMVNPNLFMYADLIVETAQSCGLFNNVKFGCEVEEPAY